jgi:hypothetical protein
MTPGWLLVISRKRLHLRTRHAAHSHRLAPRRCARDHRYRSTWHTETARDQLDHSGVGLAVDRRRGHGDLEPPAVDWADWADAGARRARLDDDIEADCAVALDDVHRSGVYVALASRYRLCASYTGDVPDTPAPKGARFWIAFVITMIVVGGAAIAFVVWAVLKLT